MKNKIKAEGIHIYHNNQTSSQKVKLKRPKKQKITINQLTSANSTQLQSKHPKIISIALHKTEPKKKKSRKQPQQQPEFFKEFEQITKIYQQSQQIQNEEQFSLLCLDETLDERGKRPKSKSYYSISNRFSQKSASLLPSIAQKEVQEQKQQDFLITTIKHPHQKTSSAFRDMSTISNYRSKISKSANDHYVNEFEIKGKSKQKKIALDVQHVIRGKSRGKSKMSQRQINKKAWH